MGYIITYYNNNIAQRIARLYPTSVAWARFSEYPDLLHFTPNRHSYYSLFHKKYHRNRTGIETPSNKLNNQFHNLKFTSTD